MAVISSTLVCNHGLFPLWGVLCWSPEQENLDLQTQTSVRYTYAEIEGLIYDCKTFDTNVTTFVESVETELLRAHPQASPLFAVSLGHIGLCLLPRLVPMSKGHYKKNGLTAYLPKVQRCDLL